MIPSLAEQSSASLFRNIIERGWGMLNYEPYNKSLILLQIEAFKYIIRPHSVVINLSQPRALQLKLNLSVLQSVQYEQSSISSWRSVPEEHFLLTALLIACFRWRLSPIKQILIKSSVDRLTLDYCTKKPTWHSEYSYWIPLYELKFECPPNVQVDLGAEGSIGRWNLLPHMKSNQAKATTT